MGMFGGSGIGGGMMAPQQQQQPNMSQECLPWLLRHNRSLLTMPVIRLLACKVKISPHIIRS